jgi:preprotein translocase subunit YajC
MSTTTPKYNIGDTVTLANGTTGTVQTITITATGVNYNIKTTITAPQTRIVAAAETTLK